MKKKDLESDISTRLNRISTLIGHEKKTMKFSSKEVVHFPLFFSEQVAPNISMEYMDSCATAIGLFSYKMLHDTNDEDKTVVNNAIRAVLKMQNPDKSWSSVMYQGNDNQKKQLDGIIIEICFALNALIECSFLDKTYLYDETVLAEFQIEDIQDRINFVVDSVKWLNDNKEDQGWYYTTTRHFTETNSILPAASSTIGVIDILNRITLKFKALQKENVQIKQQDINLIETLMQNAIKTLFDMQKSSGGFSKKRGDPESIAQTSNAIIVLLQLDENFIKPEYEHGIKRAIDWLLPRMKNIYDDEIVDVTDYIDEYDQIIVEDQRPLKRPIRHETQLDIHSFIAILKVSLSERYLKLLSFRKKVSLHYHLKKMYHHIMGLQTDQGQYCGAFKCRRIIQSEKYPIYSTYLAIIAFKSMQNEFEKFYMAYSTINKYYTQLAMIVIGIIIVAFVLIFGDINSALVVFALSVAGNVVANPIIRKFNFKLF